MDDFTWDGTKWVLNEGVVDCSGIIGSAYMRPGAPKYKDIALNADKLDEEGNVIGKTTDGKLTVADRTVIGNAAPDFTGGFNISAYVKGFDFSANFNFMIGNQVYNANKIEFTSSRNSCVP